MAFDQNRFCGARDDLGTRDPAAAALRSAHGAGMEGSHSGSFTEYYGNGGNIITLKPEIRNSPDFIKLVETNSNDQNSKYKTIQS
jgi:hypothetical protein